MCIRDSSSTYPDDGGLFAKAAEDGEAIAAAYESCDFARAMRIIMQAADRANQYVDNEQPWKLSKQGPQEQQKLQDVASVSLNLFRQLVVYLTPVLPKLADSVAQLVGPPITDWQQSQTPLEDLPVATFQPLMKRIESSQIDALLAASNTSSSTPQGSTVSETSNINPEPGALAQDSTEPLESEALAETCTIDDFSKVDLRVARVVDAEEVPEARKLIKLTVSLGGDDRRTIFAGIKKFHRPEDLHGRLVVIVANLAPRQMKFGLSEGMIVAASGAGADGVYLLSPDSGALPGMRLG